MLARGGRRTAILGLNSRDPGRSGGESGGRAPHCRTREGRAANGERREGTRMRRDPGSWPSRTPPRRFELPGHAATPAVLRKATRRSAPDTGCEGSRAPGLKDSRPVSEAASVGCAPAPRFLLPRAPYDRRFAFYPSPWRNRRDNERQPRTFGDLMRARWRPSWSSCRWPRRSPRSRGRAESPRP